MAKAENAIRTFLISYVQHDSSWAEWLAWHLDRTGLNVTLGAWNAPAGTNWVHDLNEGIAAAATTICLISPEYLADAVSTASWQSVWAHDPLGAAKQIVTIRIKPCDRPGLLAGLYGVDVYNDREDDAWGKISRLIGVTPTIMQTDRSPAYPLATGGARSDNVGEISPYISPRNRFFAGRVRELEQISSALRVGPEISLVTLKGLRGAGKTDIAVEYAYRMLADYDGVHYIRGDDPALLATEFHRLLRYFGFDGGQLSANALKDELRATLSRASSWLIVLTT